MTKDATSFAHDTTNASLIVGVLGLGHVGLPLATLLTSRGLRVVGYDVDESRILNIRAGDPGLYEPGLESLLQEALLSDRFSLTSDGDSLAEVNVPIIAIGTPWDERNQRPDLGQLNEAIRVLGRNLRKDAVVILKSTVAPGTTQRRVVPQLESLSGLKVVRDFGVAFSPERIVEGQAISDFQSLPEVIGATDDRAYRIASSVLGTLGGSIVRVSSPRTAEMVKMLDNYNRDGSLALVNEFALICMAASVDVLEVLRAAQFEYPRNKGLLIPGGGVGGSCLNKDPWILRHFAQEHGVDNRLISVFRSVNSDMPMQVVRLTETMAKRLGLNGARTVVAGLAFKSNTDDTRYSPGLTVCRELSRLGYEVRVSDPYVKCAEGIGRRTTIIPDIVQAAAGFNIVVFMSDHDEYKKMDLCLLRRSMATPAGLIDARHVVDPIRALSLGFDFEGIGRPKEAFV